MLPKRPVSFELASSRPPAPRGTATCRAMLNEPAAPVAEWAPPAAERAPPAATHEEPAHEEPAPKEGRHVTFDPSLPDDDDERAQRGRPRRRRSRRVRELIRRLKARLLQLQFAAVMQSIRDRVRQTLIVQALLFIFAFDGEVVHLRADDDDVLDLGPEDMEPLTKTYGKIVMFVVGIAWAVMALAWISPYKICLHPPKCALPSCREVQEWLESNKTIYAAIDPECPVDWLERFPPRKTHPPTSPTPEHPPTSPIPGDSEEQCTSVMTVSPTEGSSTRATTSPRTTSTTAVPVSTTTPSTRRPATTAVAPKPVPLTTSRPPSPPSPPTTSRPLPPPSAPTTTGLPPPLPAPTTNWPPTTSRPSTTSRPPPPPTTPTTTGLPPQLPPPTTSSSSPPSTSPITNTPPTTSWPPTTSRPPPPPTSPTTSRPPPPPTPLTTPRTSSPQTLLPSTSPSTSPPGKSEKLLICIAGQSLRDDTLPPDGMCSVLAFGILTISATGGSFEDSHNTKAFEFLLDKIEKGAFKKTKSGLAIDSAMEGSYSDADNIKFLTRYTDVGMTYIGLVHVANFTSFLSGSKDFIKVTSNYFDNLAKKKGITPLSYFVGLLPSSTKPSAWVQVAMQIEDEMNRKVIFVLETYETAAGVGSKCFVGGTAWLLPNDCGRPSLKAWLDHENQAQFKHDSFSMPAVSVGATVYAKVMERSTQSSTLPLSDLRKPESKIGTTVSRGDVCIATGWTRRGLDQMFQQEFWVMTQGRSSRGRRMTYSSFETAETLKNKVSACSRIGGVTIVNVDFDMNCANEHFELLKAAKEQCQSGDEQEQLY
ncbi:uncharacterized protein [Dermacentor andersoni]|uniref:uncharacterized protein n=1 Tax=Dermacentor andersoni TaxID=34620 RepID=UPI0024175D4E|nr:mucin-3A-like [Dermacentor andersoni]